MSEAEKSRSKKVAVKKAAVGAKTVASKKVAAQKAAPKKAAPKPSETVSKVQLGDLPTRMSASETETAQRFLDAAAQSVRSALESLNNSRNLRRTASGHLPKGRLTDGEEDSLRAAIVFAGAGIDTTLKQLIRDALAAVTKVNDDARQKFAAFVEDFLSEGEIGVNPKRLAGVLLDDQPPWDAFQERYVRRLTGDSLQSADQVGAVCTALGITEAGLRKRIRKGSDLDTMFRARNEIIHELDLIRDGETTPGNRSKRNRTINKSVSWAEEALSVAQEIVNATAKELQ